MFRDKGEQMNTNTNDVTVRISTKNYSKIKSIGQKERRSIKTLLDMAIENFIKNRK